MRNDAAMEQAGKAPMHDTDTIAAIATPLGTGGIGIVRISGTESLRIAAALFRASSFSPEAVRSHHLYHGAVIDPGDGSPIDEALLSFMRAPSSYTGEDVVEINLHGGVCVLQKVLALACAAGARVARPGEFTRRAFCNGRIDLAQAEAVMDIVHARTEAGLKLASRALAGGLSEKISGLMDELIDIAAHLEAAIDFPEDDIAPQQEGELARRAAAVAAVLRRLSATADRGMLYRTGVQAVIAGRPNVGKSSLMNALIGEYRAIVTPHPGTTRDVIQETVSIQGVPVHLADTAGVRDSGDDIEQIGVAMTRARIEAADLVLLVLDGNSLLDAQDRVLLQLLGDKKFIVVINKADLPQAISPDEVHALSSGAAVVRVSALTHQGIDLLRDSIADAILHGRALNISEIMVTSIRHKRALEHAAEALARLVDGLAAHLAPELVAVDLQAALSSLGDITGRTASDDILDAIFNTFCIGK